MPKDDPVVRRGVESIEQQAWALEPDDDTSEIHAPLARLLGVVGLIEDVRRVAETTRAVDQSTGRVRAERLVQLRRRASELGQRFAEARSSLVLLAVRAASTGEPSTAGGVER